MKQEQSWLPHNWKTPTKIADIFIQWTSNIQRKYLTSISYELINFFKDIVPLSQSGKRRVESKLGEERPDGSQASLVDELGDAPLDEDQQTAQQTTWNGKQGSGQGTLKLEI